MIRLPRLRKQQVTAGDIREIVRSSAKERFEIQRDGPKLYLRAAQGHARTEIDQAQAYTKLDPVEVPKLLAHGSYWEYCRSIYQSELVPGGRSSQRTHTHMVSAEVSETEIKSGFRNDATMILFIAGREAIAGIEFLLSSNGVYLTLSVISPIYFRGTRTGTEYDNVRVDPAHKEMRSCSHAQSRMSSVQYTVRTKEALSGAESCFY